MKYSNPIWQFVVPLLVVALLAQGCVTKELWQEKYYHPAQPTNLELAVAPGRQMALVQYDEQYEDTPQITRRAYWIDLNDPYATPGRPIFITATNQPNLQPIPILPAVTATNQIPTNGFAARHLAAKKGFELWRDGVAVGEFLLPDYLGTAPADFTRISTTPLAVLADGVIVVAVVVVVAGVIFAYCYLQSRSGQTL